MKKSFFITIVLLFFCKFSFAQKKIAFEFGHITEQNGLANNYVNCFLYDNDGFLWIGTKDGLNRFDGSHFDIFKSNYQVKNALLHNAIADLCEDKQGNIWIATSQGVSCFDKKRGLFINFKTYQNVAIGACFNILCDKKGLIWLSSQKRIYCINPSNFSFVEDTTQFGFMQIPEINYANSMIEDTLNGGLWIASDNGLNFLDFKAKQTYNFKNNPKKLPIFKDNFVLTLTIDDGKLLFSDSVNQQIITFDLITQKIVKVYNFSNIHSSTSGYITYIFVDKKHNIWVSYIHNAYLIDSETGEIKEIESKQINETISSKNVFFQSAWHSPEGTVWLGGYEILTINPDKIPYKSYDIGKLVPSDDKNEQITAFAEDTDKSMWLGTWKRKLLHFSAAKNTAEVFVIPEHHHNTLYHTYIHTLVNTPKSVYVVVFDGVYVLDKKTKKILPFLLFPSIDGVKIRVMSFVLRGDFIWLRTSASSVFSYQISQKKWKEFPIDSEEKIKERGRLFLAFDKNGNLWANLYPGGLAKFSEKKQKFVTENIKNHNEFEFWFTRIIADNAGNFWFPTMGSGLVKYDTKKKTYENWRESNGLVSDECFSVVLDKSDNVWVGAFDKISLMNQKDHFINFRLPYNKGLETYRNIMYLLDNQNIISVHKNILVEFLHENIYNPKLQGNLLISSIQLQDSTLYLNSSVKVVNLGKNENNFDIKYASFSNSQESYNYFYQLKGVDKNWINAGTKTVAHYTNVSGGDYQFLVKVVTGEDVSKSQSLHIHIAPIFYKSRWFWIFIGILFTLLAYTFYRFRVKQTAEMFELRMKTKQLEIENNIIQYQNLINHLNPHFLFNSLSSLNGMIMSDSKLASNFLEKLSMMYRYILHNKDSQLVNLSREISFLQHYIDLQKTRFEGGFSVDIDVKASIRNRQIVPVTLQNLLENAIKHNIVDEDSPLIVKIYDREDWLYVENNLQKKKFVETSNKQGLSSLKTLYHFLSKRDMEFIETEDSFVVKIPLL